ncbi:MAG: hypothetical protein OEU49_05965 [Chromatiales bacterium]|jgi:hypothetical protein|nr:hypothetical protein [Chromatiales bacterium]
MDLIEDAGLGVDHVAITKRLETVERAALIDLHHAASAEVQEAMGLNLVTIDGASVFVAERGTNIVINRVIHVGGIRVSAR